MKRLTCPDCGKKSKIEDLLVTLTESRMFHGTVSEPLAEDQEVEASALYLRCVSCPECDQELVDWLDLGDEEVGYDTDAAGLEFVDSDRVKNAVLRELGRYSSIEIEEV